MSLGDLKTWQNLLPACLQVTWNTPIAAYVACRHVTGVLKTWHNLLPACLQMTWNTPAAAYVASKQDTSPRLPAADPVPNGVHSYSGSQALGWAPAQEEGVQVADGGQAASQAESTGKKRSTLLGMCM